MQPTDRQSVVWWNGIRTRISDSDRVVFRATMHGTHLGVFRDIAPSGKQVTVTILDVVRVERGLFVEQWGGPDLLNLLQQLGAVVSV